MSLQSPKSDPGNTQEQRALVHVVMSTRHAPWPYERQTPNGDGFWDGIQFHINPTDPITEATVHFVFDEPPAGTLTNLPRERRILLVTEPPEVKQYSAAFLNQFGLVISPFPLPRGVTSAIVTSQVALPWHYGINRDRAITRENAMSLQEMRRAPVKSKLLSVICSSKTITRQQRQRLLFVDSLKRALGDKVDVFGGNNLQLGDKAEAIAPYKYHVVLENNAFAHGWTEKLADCYLGEAMPIYAGGPGLEDYFPRSAFVPIDIFDLDTAVSTVLRTTSTDTYESAVPALKTAKAAIVNDLNLFSVMARHVRELAPGGVSDAAAMSPLRTLKEFRLGQRLKRLVQTR